MYVASCWNILKSFSHDVPQSNENFGNFLNAYSPKLIPLANLEMYIVNQMQTPYFSIAYKHSILGDPP